MAPQEARTVAVPTGLASFYFGGPMPKKTPTRQKRKSPAKKKPAPEPNIQANKEATLPSDEDLETEWNRRLKEVEERNRQFALKTTQAHTSDRMIRYSRNPGCPECGIHPVVCMMRRPGYRKFRCRSCGYVFEDGG